jgi:hypothetical protein
MTTRVAVSAKIRPGKREKLMEELAGGPPFDLAKEGFTRHEVFVGDHDIVFVFEGQDAFTDVKALARKLPMAQLARMGTFVKDPELLPDRMAWVEGRGTAGLVATIRES